LPHCPISKISKVWGKAPSSWRLGKHSQDLCGDFRQAVGGSENGGRGWCPEYKALRERTFVLAIRNAYSKFI